MKVGVLALQGCIDPHLKHIASLGASGEKIRSPKELVNMDRLIIPGGESTTMLKLLHSSDLYSAIIKFGQTKPIWGICAGAILLAKEVEHPSQESLELIDLKAVRNYYGSQLDSFETPINVAVLDRPIIAQFIRAPLLSTLSSKVQVLATHRDQDILFRQGRTLAASFHVELGDDNRLHRYFLDI